MSHSLHHPPESLEEFRTRIREAFSEGVRSAKHGFHAPTLATVYNGAPDARTVILRLADWDRAALACHTDARSPKLDQLRDTPEVCWVFYDAPSKLQVRAFGTASVHTNDAFADERWAASSLSSRRCYLAPHAPGQASDTPSGNLPESVRGRIPTEAESRPGRANFAAISCFVSRIDALLLLSTGHLRAGFVVTPEGWTGTWLEP